MRFAAILLLLADSVFGAQETVASRIAAGDYRGALNALDAVGARDRDAQWHLLASKAWDGLDDPAKAVEEAQSAIMLDPHNEPARLQLAQIFLSRNTPDAAYEILSEAAPLFPDSALIRLGLGLALSGMRQYDSAIRNLEDCLRLAPDMAPAFDALGAAYLNKGDYDSLRSRAMTYSEQHPSDFRGFYYEAAAREELQLDPKDTEALVRRSLSLNPNFAAAHTLLGRVLLDQGHPAEAIPALREAIRLRSNYAPAHLYLATALRRTGHPDEARAEAEQVSRLNAEESRPAPHLLYHRGNRPPISAEGNQK